MSSNTVDIDKAFVEEFVALVNEHNAEELASILERLYAQDIADIFDELELEQAVYVASLLEDQKKVDVLTELEPEVKLKFLAGYSNEDVANTFFALMDSDDAADILNSMDTAEGKDILRKIQDKEHSKNIASLLKFPENTAGALMAKEFIKIKLNWTVKQCTDEIRKQAEDVKNVFSAFVVDDYDELVGWVSLKRILLSNEKSTVADIYNDNVKYENTYASGEEVAATIQKYDLVTLPIVDAFNRLVGIITFDDVLDYVKDEAEKDYQMLSGISDRVESTDSVWRNTRARLPWLVVGLAGGVASSLVIKGFEVEIEKNVQLALFIPLIMAMAGNVGVQSSSIMVQGLANKSIESNNVWGKLGKELFVALLNGIVCSLILMGYGFISGNTQGIMLTVSLSLLSVILLAAVIGTIVPLILDNLKIDPALATGPFITTSNDLVGLFLYFIIGNMILG